MEPLCGGSAPTMFPAASATARRQHCAGFAQGERVSARQPDPEVRLDKLAQAAGLSKFHLCRQFSATFGLSPNRYQRQLRLLQAKGLLSKGGDLAEIAIACGFADQSHLGRAFKSTYGVTPRGYRDRCI